MELSKLSEKCKKCSKVDTCDHKKMEALAIADMPKGGFAVEGIIPLVDTGIQIVGTLNGNAQISCAEQTPNELNESILEAIKKALSEENQLEKQLTITISRS